MPDQVRQGIVLTVLSAVVFVTGLGATHLWDDDETYFAEVAREMHERDDLIVPWFNHKLFAHKPPFMYWMMIGAYRTFGVNEFAARFPSAVFGLANVLLLWRLGRRLYSPRAGFWAAAVLATSLNFTVIARAAASDAELTFFCMLAIYLFVRGWARQQPSWKTYAQAYAAMGMAVLVKGPIGVLLPTSVLGLFLLWRGQVSQSPLGTAWQSPPDDNLEPAFPGTSADFVLPASAPAGGAATIRRIVACIIGPLVSPRLAARTIWSMRPLTALAMVLLVAGPWYLAVSIRTDGEFLRGFFGVHHFGRFLNPMDNHPGPAWFYLAAMCVGFFPWIVFLSPMLADACRRMRAGHRWASADVLCAAWFVVWFGFFSLASTKFPHYVVPAYPALALATAAFLDRWMGHHEIYGRLARRGAWLTVGAVGVGIMVVVPIVERFYLHEFGLAGLAGLPLIVAAAAGAHWTERRQVGQAVTVLTAGAAVFLVAVFALAAVEVDKHQTSQQIADAIRRHARGERPQIGRYHYYRPGVTFYCREPVEKLFHEEEVVAFLNGEPPRYLLTSSDDYPVLADRLPPGTEVLEQLPWFLKEGKGIVVLGRNGSESAGSPASATAGRGEPVGRDRR